jgi:hypothetical protein
MRTTLATHAILGPAGGSQRLRSSVPRRKPMRYRLASRWGRVLRPGDETSADYTLWAAEWHELVDVGHIAAILPFVVLLYTGVCLSRRCDDP